MDLSQITTALSTGGLAMFVAVAVLTYHKKYWYTGREFEAQQRQRSVDEERHRADIDRERKESAQWEALALKLMQQNIAVTNTASALASVVPTAAVQPDANAIAT